MKDHLDQDADYNKWRNDPNNFAGGEVKERPTKSDDLAGFFEKLSDDGAVKLFEMLEKLKASDK